MVFLSSPAPEKQHFWEKTLPVRPLIEALLGGKDEFKKNVLFTDDNDAVVAFLKSHKVA